MLPGTSPMNAFQKPGAKAGQVKCGEIQKWSKNACNLRENA